MEQLYFARLRPGAIIPSKRAEDAGYDIYACFDEDELVLEPLATRLVPTGLASACPAGYYFQLQERGSTGTRGIAQRCGVIDSGYRDEWFVPLTNLNHVPLHIAHPDQRPRLDEAVRRGECLAYYTDKAIAQAVLLPVPPSTVSEISYDQLLAMTSQRMTGKLGSSNK